MIIFLSMCYEASNDAALAIFCAAGSGDIGSMITTAARRLGAQIATIRRIAISYDGIEAYGDARIYRLLGEQIRTHNNY